MPARSRLRDGGTGDAGDGRGLPCPRGCRHRAASRQRSTDRLDSPSHCVRLYSGWRWCRPRPHCGLRSGEPGWPGCTAWPTLRCRLSVTAESTRSSPSLLRQSIRCQPAPSTQSSSMRRRTADAETRCGAPCAKVWRTSSRGAGWWHPCDARATVREELRADDRATRRLGRPAVARALLAMAPAATTASTVAGFGDAAVPRVEQLLGGTPQLPVIPVECAVRAAAAAVAMLALLLCALPGPF